jgi:hypothetical protein
MATKKQSENNESIAGAIRRAGTAAIDTYERQTKEAILQGEQMVKDVPVVRSLASTQASIARYVVDAQTSTARQFISA